MSTHEKRARIADRQHRNLENSAEYVALADACDFLEHYHIDHSGDTITRFRGKLKGRDVCADIYVTCDPEWKRKLYELTKSEFGELPT